MIREIGKLMVATVLMLSIPGYWNIAVGQTIDSTSIADFFHPQRMSAINEASKDSLWALIGEGEELQDIYRFHEAKLYLQTGQIDLARQRAEEAIEALPADVDPYAKAKYFNIIANVYANKQETLKAIQFFEQALSVSEEAHEAVHAALMRSNIANMYFSLVDYESAYQYIAQAYQTMKAHPDHPNFSSLVAVLSISEAKIGKMVEAKEHGQMAIDKAETTGNVVALIVANLALGEVANSGEAYEDAKKHFLASLEISERYQQKPFILLNSIGLMTANLGTENYPAAVTFGEKALDLVGQGGDQTTVYSIKKNLAEAYFGVNQPRKAYQLMRESHDVFRDKNSIENKKAINDILLKYDAEKKEKDLIVARNALLQQQVESNKLWMVLGVLFLLLIGLLAGMMFIRQRNENRIALMQSMQEKAVLQAVFDGEEIERERIAYELHDGVASNLTALRYQLMANQNIPEEDKAQLEAILLQAHEDTRRLSHNLAPLYLDQYGFAAALQQFASENQHEQCQVSVQVIPEGKTIAKESASVLYRVAQELTQNAMKHAEATEISIQLMIAEELTLVVEDNGKGFDFDSVKDSNGMASMARRAAQLKGSFDVDTRPGQGTIATFVLPQNV
ncbi:MAG: sensor histidine kinase [Bacteroidia bacterium]|nr:sensor histidine kinase [Bacteroidia bacterium]